MKCSNCGTEFEEGVFCPECGTKVENNLPNGDSTEPDSIVQEISVEREGQSGNRTVENEEVFCPKCGDKFDASLSFCPFCGTKLIPRGEYKIENRIEKKRVEEGYTNKEEERKERNRKKNKWIIITVVTVPIILGVVDGLLSFIFSDSAKEVENATIEREMVVEENTNEDVLKKENEVMQIEEEKTDVLDEEDVTLQNQGLKEEKMADEQPDAGVNTDYEQWVGDYVRTSGPSSGIYIWSADENGIMFAAGIGGSGYLAYRDIRDCYAEWVSDSMAVYVDKYDNGGRIEISLLEDGTLNILEEREDMENTLSLSGVYEKPEGQDQAAYEFVLPDSDRRLVTENDLENLSPLECRIARNEIYARRGRLFADEQLQNYFDVCTWYRGEISGEDFSLDMLSDIERENTEFISAYEEKMGYK